MKQLVTFKKYYRRKDSFGGKFHFSVLVVVIILAISRISLVGQIFDDLMFGFVLGISKYLFFLIVLVIYFCYWWRRKVIFSKKLLIHGILLWGWVLFMLSCIVMGVSIARQSGVKTLFQANNLRINFGYFWRHWAAETFLSHFHRGDFWTARGQWFSLWQTTSGLFDLIVTGLSIGSFATVIGIGVAVAVIYIFVVSLSHPQPTTTNFKTFNLSSEILNRQLFAQMQLTLPANAQPPQIKLLPTVAQVSDETTIPLDPLPPAPNHHSPTDVSSATVHRWLAPRTSHRPDAKVVQVKREQLTNQLQIDPFGHRMTNNVRQEAVTPKITNAVVRNPVSATRQVQMIEQQNQKFNLLKNLRQAHTPLVERAVSEQQSKERYHDVPRRLHPLIANEQLQSDAKVSSDSLTNLAVGKLGASDQNLTSTDQKRSKINQLFATFGVKAKVVHYVTGPTVTRFEVALRVGSKVQSVINLEKDLKLVLGTGQLRIVYPVGDKSLIGLEIPNEKPTFFTLTTVLNQVHPTKMTNSLLVALGRKIDGELVLMNLNKTPHLLIAGSTGSGKSVCINVIISCLIYQASPAQLRLVLIDPKRVELNFYEALPHLLCPVIYDAVSAGRALKIIIKKIHRRYDKFKQHHKRNIQEYNQDPRIKYKLPFIVVVIDELADLMASLGRGFETSVQTIAQLARAAGIHLVLSTQRPSTDVITGIIKANIPSRIAFKASNGVDSRTIIDQVGAEKLVGNGDMLYQTVEMSYPARAQGTFIDNQLISALITEVKTKYSTHYDAEFIQQQSAVPPAWRRLDN